jgi:hypothetical protein
MRWVAPLALVVAVAAAGSAATGAPLYVVDRTFACNPLYGQASFVASPRGTPEVQGSRIVSSGYLRLSGSELDPLADVVVVARPGPRTGGTRYAAAVYASVRRCAATRTRIPLSRVGLPGPPTRYRSEAECFVNARVLVRVRAVLAARAPWRRLRGLFRGYAGAAGRVVEAQLAMRDQQRGKPLAFATLDRTGKTRLWSSFDCT